MSKTVKKAKGGEEGSPCTRIDFTAAEYRQLLKCLFIADWVEEGGDTEEKAADPLQTLRAKVFASIEKMGAQDCYTALSDEGGYEATDTFVHSIMRETILPYNNDFFWTTLIGKLSERELNKKYTEAESQALPKERFVEEVHEMRRCYANEFDAHDLDNLKVVRNAVLH